MTGAPGEKASLRSSTIRSEFTAIQNAMAKLPTYTSNANGVVVVNAGGTGLSVKTTGLSLASPTLASATLTGSLTAAGATWSDLGTVSAATSITSTEFVGPLTGDVTGNVSGSAETVTGSAQSAITSVGTLTSLAVAGSITTNTGHLIATAGSLILSAGSVRISPTYRFYPDGGGDTYIQESSANVLNIVTGGTSRFSISSAGVQVSNADLMVESLKKLYFDEGGDTYITEGSANIMSFYSGAVNGLNIGSTNFSILLNTIEIPATAKFKFDGGGDTYLWEQSGNNLKVVVGNVERTAWNSLGLTVTNGGLIISSGEKFFLDNGGDTYLWENGSNVMELVTAGVTRLQITGATTKFLSTDLSVSATKKLFLDDGSNTYFIESSADVVDLYTGGVKALTVDASQNVTLAVGDLTISNGNVQATSTTTATRSFDFINNAAVTTDIFRVYTGASDTASRNVLTLHNDTNTATGTTVLNIRQDANSNCIKVAGPGSATFFILDGAGDVSMPNGSISVEGQINALSSDAQIGYESSLGAVLAGQGLTNDVSILNDNQQVAIAIPTGTTNVQLPSLAGTGTRNVVVDANGVMSAP